MRVNLTEVHRSSVGWWFARIFKRMQVSQCSDVSSPPANYAYGSNYFIILHPPKHCQHLPLQQLLLHSRHLLNVFLLVALLIPYRTTNPSNICGHIFNARSIVNKLNDLHYFLYNTGTDLCFITETWLHNGISSGVLDPKCEFTVLQKRSHYV